VEHRLEKIDCCQICQGTDIKDFIRVIDHNYSGDEFNLSECVNCGYRFTNPRPIESTIGNYYKSENYISHNSTKKGLINKVYHLVRNYQFKIKESSIEKTKISTGKKVLDVGCGTGNFVNHLNNHGWNAEGVETDEKAREIAQLSNIKVYKNINLVDSEKYDVITMWHVLEHVYNLNDYMQKLRGLLKKDGLLVIAVPNSNSYDANIYKENWYAYDAPIHISHFRKSNMKILAEKNNFKLTKTQRLFFDAFYISMLSSKKSSKPIWLGFLVGLISNTKAKKDGEYSSLIYYLFK
jgi:2-polyprenyl-3-methyl-5-hydroxy-6-metoxy-1,4-benzoquinol methylase